MFLSNHLSNSINLVGKTEIIKESLNPVFKTTFVLDFIFEIEQILRFDVLDIDGEKEELIGQCNTTVAELFGADHQTSIHDINSKNKSHGKIIFQMERIPINNSTITIDLGKS